MRKTVGKITKVYLGGLDGKMNLFLLDNNRKPQILFNDLVIERDVCNLSCSYCLSNESPFDANGKGTYMNYSENSQFGNNLIQVINSFDDVFNASILRLSGGELFLIKGIEKFIYHCSRSYEKVQVITNGTMLNKDIIQSLADMGNCSLHFSLDGNTLKMNGYRVNNIHIQNKILNNIEYCVSKNIDVEIGSVLTDRNTRSFQSFIEYMLKNYNDSVTLYPFPIRGKNAQRFYPNNEDIGEFENILKNYKNYAAVLPPKGYIEVLYNILKKKKRELPCKLPIFAIQLFDDGTVTLCPNTWTTISGNILDRDQCYNNLINEKLYDILLQKRPRVECCKECYTSMDIVNLYLSGYISEEEILSIPLYKGEKAKRYIKKLKESINEK